MGNRVMAVLGVNRIVWTAVFCLFLALYFTLALGCGVFLPRLGSINYPTVGSIAFWHWWQSWSWLLVFCLAPVIYSTVEFKQWLVSEAYIKIRVKVGLFILLTSLPLLIHFYILQGMFITDDESAYTFAAELLSRGQLTVGAADFKYFFDRVFMVNDERFFPQYFYGWPAFLAVGVSFSAPYLINALFFSGSAYIIFYIMRPSYGSTWALLASFMFAVSPLALINSGTYLSHTSATFFSLVFLLSFNIVSRNPSAGNVRWCVLASVSAGLFFWIRPYTAFLFLCPCFVYMVLLSVRGRLSLRSILFVFLPGLLLLSAFLLVNLELNGSIFVSGYEHYAESAQKNDFRYSFWNFSPAPVNVDVSRFVPKFDFFTFIQSLYGGLLRLCYDGAGMPSMMLMLLSVVYGFRFKPITATSLMLLVVGHAYWADMGVDSYGPMHLSEAAPLLIMLFIGFLSGLSGWSEGKLHYDKGAVNATFKALALSLVFVIFICFTSVKMSNVHTMAANIKYPYDQAKIQGVSGAIVFSSVPFVNQSAISPLRHFRFWRDNPKYDLSDDILWVNDFGDQDNRRFLERFPGRKGYMMAWSKDGLELTYLPLGEHP